MFYNTTSCGKTAISVVYNAFSFYLSLLPRLSKLKYFQADNRVTGSITCNGVVLEFSRGKKKTIRDVAIEGEIYYENGLMLIRESEKILNLICLGAR
jgi:hypothetical protein